MIAYPEPRHLISQNDWARLRAALLALEEISLTRSLGDLTVVAWTARASKAWPVAAVVGIMATRPGTMVRKYTESVEAAQAALERWRA